MPRPRNRRTPIIPGRSRRSWLARLAPEVRVIGAVLIICAVLAVVVAWPRKEAGAAEKLTVVVPAGDLGAALRTLRQSFVTKHRDIDVVFVEAEAEKMPAYEKRWRKNESGVDLLIGVEAYLTRWSAAGHLEPWDDFARENELHFSHVAVDASTVGERLQMAPLAIDLPCLKFSGGAAAVAPTTLAEIETLARKLGAAGRPVLDADWSATWALPTALSVACAAAPQRRASLAPAGLADALAWWKRGIEAGWARAPGANVEDRPVLMWGGEDGWPAQAASDQTTLWALPGAVKQGTIALTYGAVMPRASRHKRAARTFVRELLSPATQATLAQASGLLPAELKAWKRKQLAGAPWGDLKNTAAQAVALPPRLRSLEIADAFARDAAACLQGKLTPQQAAASIVAPR